LAADEVLAADGVLAALSACNTPHVVIALSRTCLALPSLQTKPRKSRPATDIKRIQKATGKRVTGVTFRDDGGVKSYTSREATETNPSEAEADEALAQWKRKKNADQS
jgi:hypothetical protein